MEQQPLAAQQFGVAAADYLSSPVHANGADLKRLAGLVQAGSQVLDLGCGAGHVSYALAAAGADVMAYDLAQEILDVVAAEAARRGFANIATRQGPAERLPFADAAFDLVVSRYSAHHWSDVAAALREVRRVLKPGGRFVMIDIVAPENPQIDTVLQTIEILRDYRVSEWRAMFRAAGFEDPECTTWRLPIDFASWIARMRTSESRAQAIRDVFAQAPVAVRGYFRGQADASFEIEAVWLAATSCQ
jgi:SAM-dependent methyltransferase